MMEQIKTITSNCRSSILVDEIMKTSKIGPDFADHIRSRVCDWIGDDHCDCSPAWTLNF
jgi:hypothetical protein